MFVCFFFFWNDEKERDLKISLLLFLLKTNIKKKREREKCEKQHNSKLDPILESHISTCYPLCPKSKRHLEDS